MVDTLLLLPFSFWVVIALLAGGAVWAFGQLRGGLGLPMLAVLGTVAFWYVGDAFYNDYRTTYAIMFTEDVRAYAWWQVALFVAAFLFLAPEVHQLINSRFLRRSSQICHMVDIGTFQSPFQERLVRLFWACLWVGGALVFVAVIRLKGDAFYYFFPYFGNRADPWERGRVGTGFDFLLSFAAYFQLFVSVMFGIILALVRDRRVRLFALVACLLMWPYFLFDRTRNTMLATLMPAILSWVFLRLRLVVWQRLLILGCFFLVINAWFVFVQQHRSTASIASAFADEGFDLEVDASTHHEGLNMFEELCWINTFIGNGIYKPNWGARYFAEIVNPIPRSLWPGKPMIGIDYAILRGQAYDEGEAGVGATISTGMIGQGVVNFGRYLGPPFVALLMSLWVTLLARFDLNGQNLGRIPLYGLGLILTFNLGRDITLITLYTFVFGWILVALLEQIKPGSFSPGRKVEPSSGEKEKATGPAIAPRPADAALSSTQVK